MYVGWFERFLVLRYRCTNTCRVTDNGCRHAGEGEDGEEAEEGYQGGRQRGHQQPSPLGVVKA